ncbi:DNA internalization-related competence protein ComEC/Rec2 [Endozoicomonas sp. (ex Bugula neritina AB1)]|nr:DNA internalization-related competence protein ComEC/Rec2 [Endozoicomonas sp. (ex Bugula neritina AB1)]
MKCLLKPTLTLFLLVITIIGVSLLPDSLPQTLLMFIGLLSICLTVIAFRGSLFFPFRAAYKLKAVSWCLAVLLMGVVIGGNYARQVTLKWLPDDLNKKEVRIKGIVAGLPIASGETTRFDVLPETPVGSGYSGKIRLSWFQAQELIPGETWQFIVKLKRPHGFASEGAMDYEAWIVRQGVQATGYVKQAERLSDPAYGSQWIHSLRLSLRQWVAANSSSANQGMLIALLTGDKSGLSSQQWQRLNTSGTTHLMVISGLHIGLMAALGFWLARCLGSVGCLPLKRCSLPILASVSGLLLALLYAALAGFSIPVQRALVMTFVALCGPVVGVKPASLTLWLVALTFVLVLDPLAFTSQGFWYSFLAVGALLFGLGARRQSSSRWQALLKPQWVVFCVLTPLLLMAGQPVSFFSPVINLLAIPLIGVLVVPLLLLAALLSLCWSWMAVHILWVTDQLISLFQWLLISIEPFMAPIPAHADPGWVVTILTLIGVFLLISPAALKLRWFALVLLLPWFFPIESKPVTGQAEVTVFDVGQGLSLLIRTRHHTLIYDTGDRFTEEVSAADRVIIPGLKSAGIRSIDKVMISHGDRDHSGGLPALEKHFGELKVWAGSDIVNYDGSYTQCQEGQSWEWDGVYFQVLAGGGFKLSNECSCVLKITAGEDSLLLPGDISKKVEKKLLLNSEALKARVLLAPHHGSKYSSSAAFLTAVQPEVVIYSAGYLNQFGHPASETSERISAVGARTYNTATDGSVSYILGRSKSDQPLKLSGYRESHSRYWWRYTHSP